jgi:hypothetical protein
MWRIDAMNERKRGDGFEVLNPWADAEESPSKTISNRLADLNGKRIGLFQNSKRASGLVLDAVKKTLMENFHGLSFSSFLFMPNAGVDETEDKDRFDDWIKKVDAVVLAFGD